MRGFDDDFAGRPPLSADEERALIQAIRAGNENARKRLVEANMRLVINIAKTYRWHAVRNRIDIERLVQDGTRGLTQATERFDPDRGFRFSTYATHWIRQAIGRTLDAEDGLISHVARSKEKIEFMREHLRRESGEGPTDQQLADALAIPVEALRTLLDAAPDDPTLRLLKAIRSGDEAVRERLREEYATRIKRIARMAHLRSWGDKPFEDLILAGEAGLLQAAMQFVPGRGPHFSTYADHWIRLAVAAKIREA